NAPLLDRLGARISLLISGAGLVLATAALMAGTSVPLAVAAFALAGLAVAGVVPTVLSVAARLEPGNSGMIAGGFMAAAYAGFIIIPPITGLVADLFSVKAALLSIALSGLAILWLGRGVGQPRP
ncbi:MAG: MFS transporter, partial [Chloroflexota bacterium]|nr:MFS transporter [Chloroflexota bacterium]